MIAIRLDSIHVDSTDAPVTWLNALWYGAVSRKMMLPQLNHLLLVFPMGNRVVSCAGTTLDSNHYLILNSQRFSQPTDIDNLSGDDSQLLLLFISQDLWRRWLIF